MGVLTYEKFVFLTHMKPHMTREHRLLHVVTQGTRISGLFTSYREMVMPPSQHMVQWTVATPK